MWPEMEYISKLPLLIQYIPRKGGITMAVDPTQTSKYY